MTFFVTALGYYLYTFVSEARFTNMSALLFTTSVIIFLIGLVSEQITNLVYQQAASTKTESIPGKDNSVPEQTTHSFRPLITTEQVA
jgi:hypothetical protein